MWYAKGKRGRIRKKKEREVRSLTTSQTGRLQSVSSSRQVGMYIVDYSRELGTSFGAFQGLHQPHQPHEAALVCAGQLPNTGIAA